MNEDWLEGNDHRNVGFTCLIKSLQVQRNFKPNILFWGHTRINAIKDLQEQDVYQEFILEIFQFLSSPVNSTNLNPW